MSTYQLQLVPRDVLFLRDARPMAAADTGCGANWPRPDQLWNALIHHFHRTWPERQEWEGEKHNKNQREHAQGRYSSDRFGALTTVGPFPMLNDRPYFPWPEDLVVDEQENTRFMHLIPAKHTDLQATLPNSFSTPVLGKQNPPKWLSLSEYQQYLTGTSFKPAKTVLYDEERNIGIAINPTTRATIEGQFYQAEYLRLREQVSLAFQASCQIKPKGGGNGQLIDVLAKSDFPCKLILGGQQGVASVQVGNWQLPSVKQPQPSGKPILLRWTLLSPALFPAIAAIKEKGIAEHLGGWLPSWVDCESKQVMLPKINNKIRREPGEDRRAWRNRRRQEEPIRAKLVAARIGRPLHFSGWDLHMKKAGEGDGKIIQGPKPTQLAVPAGSVYVFECEDQQAFQDLWQVLQAQTNDNKVNRRSANFGEKGFGIGVCSLFPEQN